MKIWENLDRVIPDNQEIPEDVVRYYEENPDDLDLIINQEEFNAVFLSIFFGIGMITTVGARMVAYYFGDSLGEFINSVVLDVISEIGIAIFGGAVVAFLIETQNKKQFQQNVRFRRRVKALLEERKK
jgi:hypothetical protein